MRRLIALAVALALECDATFFVGDRHAGDAALTSQASSFERRASSLADEAAALQRDVYEQENDLQEREEKVKTLQALLLSASPASAAVDSLMLSRAQAIAKAERARKEAAVAQAGAADYQRHAAESRARVDSDSAQLQAAKRKAKDGALRLGDTGLSVADVQRLKHDDLQEEQRAEVLSTKLEGERESTESLTQRASELADEAKIDLQEAAEEMDKATSLSMQIQEDEAAVKHADGDMKAEKALEQEVATEEVDLARKQEEVKKLSIEADVDKAEALRRRAQADVVEDRGETKEVGDINRHRTAEAKNSDAHRYRIVVVKAKAAEEKSRLANKVRASGGQPKPILAPRSPTGTMKSSVANATQRVRDNSPAPTNRTTEAVEVFDKLEGSKVDEADESKTATSIHDREDEDFDDFDEDSDGDVDGVGEDSDEDEDEESVDGGIYEVEGDEGVEDDDFDDDQ